MSSQGWLGPKLCTSEWVKKIVSCGGVLDLAIEQLQLPAWKTGIRITLRGTAISADYLYNFRATERGPGPAEVDGKGVIGPAPPRSSKVTETTYKYLQTHTEVLKLCIIKSVNK